MKRKVIQLAGKTLVVSLPSKWAKEHAVLKGAEISVSEKGSKLIIETDTPVGGGCEVDLTGSMPMTKRVLGAVFKAGYDDVLVRFSSAAELAAAQEVIREEFIGFEVVERGKNSLHVRSVSQLSASEFETMLRRLFLTVLGMAEESCEAGVDTLWLGTIALTDKDVNKYADFCRRLLNQHTFSLSSKPLPLYYILEQLERVGDLYRDACKVRIDGSAVGDAKLYADVARFLRLMYECYYDFSLQKMAAIGKMREELRERVAAHILAAKKKELAIAVILSKLVDDIFDLNGAVMAGEV